MYSFLWTIFHNLYLLLTHLLTIVRVLFMFKMSVDSSNSSSHPTSMSAGTVPPGAPPLIVRPPIIDSSSTGSLLASITTLESARRIVGSARIKVRSPTESSCILSILMFSHILIVAPAPKKKRGLCSGKKMEDIIQQTGKKIKLEYCPCVKGSSVRGINSLVTHNISCVMQSLVRMWARMFYDLDQTEKWKVWNAMSPKYEWDENDESMFNWILKRAQERYKDWKYQCHKYYQLEGPSGMPSDFIGREDQWEFLC
ncbi:hypothetical protein ACLB2K_026259 [Fragaria x ananassa]